MSFECASSEGTPVKICRILTFSVLIWRIIIEAVSGDLSSAINLSPAAEVRRKNQRAQRSKGVQHEIRALRIKGIYLYFHNIFCRLSFLTSLDIQVACIYRSTFTGEGKFGVAVAVYRC